MIGRSNRWHVQQAVAGFALSAFLLGCPNTTTTKTVYVYLDAGVVSGAYGSSISGRPASRQVPQGAGAVTLVITGNGLSGASSVTCDLPAVVAGASSDTSANVTLTVPHGARIGAHDVTVTTPQGTFTLVGAVVVTAITADPAGSDSNLGTTDSPFHTATHALAQSSGGDLVHLNAGVFTNEPWTPENSSVFPPASIPNVPAGVTLEGDDAGSTVIALGTNPDGGGFVGLSLSGDNTVRHLSITGFERNAVLWSGDLNVDGVEIAAATSDGLLAFGDGGIWLLGNSHAHHNGAASVAAFNNVAVHAVGMTIDHSVLTGLYLADNASADFLDSRFLSNGGYYSSSRNGAVGAFSLGNVSFTGCTFDQNHGYGIVASGGIIAVDHCTITHSSDHLIDGGNPGSGYALWSALGASMDISNSTVDQSTNGGLYVNYWAQATVQNSSISNTAGTSVQTYSQGQLMMYNTTIQDAGSYGVFASGQQTALNSVTISNIQGFGVRVYGDGQLSAHGLTVSKTSSDGLNVDSANSVAVVDNAWFDQNLSAMSVYAGSLRASSVIVSDAGFHGLYVEGNGNAWLTTGSNDAGLLGFGGIGTGTAFMTIRESDPGAPAGFCIYDNRPSANIGSLRTDGVIHCNAVGSWSPYSGIAGPASFTGPFEEYNSADAGIFDIVNGATWVLY